MVVEWGEAWYLGAFEEEPLVVGGGGVDEEETCVDRTFLHDDGGFAINYAADGLSGSWEVGNHVGVVHLNDGLIDGMGTSKGDAGCIPASIGRVLFI